MPQPTGPYYIPPIFSAPPTVSPEPDHARREHAQYRPNMDSHFQPMYNNTWQNQYPPPPLQPRHNNSNSNSNDSNRSQRGSHIARETTRGRPEDDGLARSGIPPPGHVSREHYVRTRERRRRSPSSSSSSSSGRSRRRRSTHEKKGSSRNGGDEQKQIQQTEPETKRLVDKIITPFNVGILLGCFDIVGGSLSVYMTRKRFSKKAQAAEAAKAAVVAGGGGGSGAGGQNQGEQGNDSRRRSRSRRRGRRDSTSSSDSHDSRDSRYGGGRQREPRRLEYERLDRGRFIPRAGRWAAHPAARRM